MARDGAERGSDLVVAELGELGDDIQRKRAAEGQAVGWSGLVDPLPERDQQDRQALQQQVGAQVAAAGKIGEIPPGDAGDGGEREPRREAAAVLAPDVAPYAGQKSAAGQRDRQAVPDQARIVGRKVIPGRAEGGQQQPDQEQAVPGPARAEIGMFTRRREFDPAPNRHQRKAEVGDHVREMGNAEYDVPGGEVVIAGRLGDRAVDQRGGGQQHGYKQRQMVVQGFH
jgi:hypothetical protein